MGASTSWDLETILLLMHPKIAFAFFLAESYCWLIFSLWSTMIPRSSLFMKLVSQIFPHFVTLHFIFFWGAVLCTYHCLIPCCCFHPCAQAYPAIPTQFWVTCKFDLAFPGPSYPGHLLGPKTELQCTWLITSTQFENESLIITLWVQFCSQ